MNVNHITSFVPEFNGGKPQITPLSTAMMTFVCVRSKGTLREGIPLIQNSAVISNKMINIFLF